MNLEKQVTDLLRRVAKLETEKKFNAHKPKQSTSMVDYGRQTAYAKIQKSIKK